MQKMFVILHRFVYWLIANNEEFSKKAYVQEHDRADDYRVYTRVMHGKR